MACRAGDSEFHPFVGHIQAQYLRVSGSSEVTVTKYNQVKQRNRMIQLIIFVIKMS